LSEQGWAVPGSAVAKRQTVLFGPVNSDGTPSFLPASAGGLVLTSQNISSSFPLVATAANGFISSSASDTTGSITSNLQWTLPNGATSYLFVTVSGGTLTANNTTTAPIYQFGGTASTSSGQYTYVISSAQMYLGNGSVANAVQVVFVGEAVTSAGNITGTTAYAYQGYAEYNDTGSLPSASQIVTKNHNLGVNIGVFASLSIVNSTAEYGYAIGDILYNGFGSNSSSSTPWFVNIGRNYWKFSTETVVAWQTLDLSSPGVLRNLTGANWRYRLTAQRNW
jgi:hypothetical protein